MSLGIFVDYFEISIGQVRMIPVGPKHKNKSTITTVCFCVGPGEFLTALAVQSQNCLYDLGVFQSI